jgi:hypothetical protein
MVKSDLSDKNPHKELTLSLNPCKTLSEEVKQDFAQ